MKIHKNIGILHPGSYFEFWGPSQHYYMGPNSPRPQVPVHDARAPLYNITIKIAVDRRNGDSNNKIELL